MTERDNCEIPMYKTPDNEAWEILKNIKSIAVVGMSTNPEKPGHYVPAYLLEKGYRIFPVNPSAAGKVILGQKVYSNLNEIPGEVDAVEVFRPSDEVSQIADEAVKKGAKILWMQTGIVNNEAAQKAQRAGMKVIMDKCMMALHKAKS